MKWGVRRYQNSDGSLTNKGREHYSSHLVKTLKRTGKGFAESVKHPKQFVKSYKEDLTKTIKAIPKAFLKKMDSEVYRKNPVAKSFQMTKDVYSKSINDSKNPLIKAARDIARDEANRLYSKNGAKLPVLDNFSRFSVNLTSKLVYKKDYLDKLSDREKLELKKEMAYYMLLSNQYD